MDEEETTVTRKYQITIPKGIRRSLGIRIGEKLKVSRQGRSIVIEEEMTHVKMPSDFLWGLSKKPTDIDAVKLVKTTRKRVV
jgi:AbrB family looped-hinge helix DNA binding protein